MDADTINQNIGKVIQWQKDHERHDDNRFVKIEERLDKIESTIDSLPTKEDLKDLVKESMLEALTDTGRSAKYTLLTIATIIGALAVIGGGFKWILGFIGFEYIVK